MDAGNSIGPAGAASFAPALERMPQLTLLNLKGARIGLGRGSSVGGFGCLRCCLGVRLNGALVWGI